MGFPRLDEDTLHQGTGSQAEGRQRARGWCEAQPRELGSCAQVIPVLPPVLLGASPWSYELAAQASAGEELCLLPPAALEKQKGRFDQGLGGMKGGRQTEDSLSGVASYLVQIVFLTVPRGKESLVPHLFPVCSQGALKEGAKPSVLRLCGACGAALCAWVLPYHGTCGEKRCQMVFPKSSTWRGTFCTHQRPGVHKSAFWSLCSTVYLTVPLAKNYSADRMTHRSVVHILRNCGELQAA